MRWQRLFAPWQWGPRWLCLWIGTAVVVFFVMAVPVERAIDTFNAPPAVRIIARTVYAPTWWMAKRSDAFFTLLLSEDRLMTKILGKPQNPTRCNTLLAFDLARPIWLDFDASFEETSPDD